MALKIYLMHILKEEKQIEWFWYFYLICLRNEIINITGKTTILFKFHLTFVSKQTLTNLLFDRSFCEQLTRLNSWGEKTIDQQVTEKNRKDI